MANIYKSRFTGAQIDQMLENASRAANIEANPSGEATVELTKLKIGDTTYSIPEGTEGTVVEGNPSGEATVELTKLKIGNTIYSIPLGGGGANPFENGFTLTFGSTSGMSNIYIINTNGSLTPKSKSTYENVLGFQYTISDCDCYWADFSMCLSFNKTKHAAYFILPNVNGFFGSDNGDDMRVLLLKDTLIATFLD